MKDSSGDHRPARAVMKRAIRRLGILEWLALAGAAVASLAGGALAAYLAGSAFGLPFWYAWPFASLLFFVVPGLTVLTRDGRGKAPKTEGGGWRSKKD